MIVRLSSTHKQLPVPSCPASRQFPVGRQSAQRPKKSRTAFFCRSKAFSLTSPLIRLLNWFLMYTVEGRPSPLTKKSWLLQTLRYHRSSARG